MCRAFVIVISVLFLSCATRPSFKDLKIVDAYGSEFEDSVVWVDFVALKESRFTLVTRYDWDRHRYLSYIRKKEGLLGVLGKHPCDESDKAFLAQTIYLEIRRRWPMISIDEGSNKGPVNIYESPEARQKMALRRMYSRLQSERQKSN